MIRVDGALKPPGFIASAAMFTLILKDNHLYILRTGPGVASQSIYTKALLDQRQSRKAIDNLATSAVAKSVMKKVKKGEEQIDNGDPDTLAGEKGSVKVPVSDVQDVETNKRSELVIRLTFKAANKKWKLDCSTIVESELTELVQGLKAG